MTQSHGSKKMLPFWFSLKLRAKPGTQPRAIVTSIHSCPDSDINDSLHTLISCPWEEVLNTMFRDGHRTHACWRRWLTKVTWRPLSPSVNGTVHLPFSLLLTTGLSQSYEDVLSKVRLHIKCRRQSFSETPSSCWLGFKIKGGMTSHVPRGSANFHLTASWEMRSSAELLRRNSILPTCNYVSFAKAFPQWKLQMSTQWLSTHHWLKHFVQVTSSEATT